MAIYHLSVKVISRSTGASALAAGAYRCGGRLYDERLNRHHDFTRKENVIHSEVMLPEGAPETWRDRETLWNRVELGERRKDAQLAREVEFAIPREMTQAQGIELAQDFVAREFVSRGMVADLNVHWDQGLDGEMKPHAHVMLTMREIEGQDFGAKVREWNATSLVEHWREAWAECVNERLAELDLDVRIDHRSFEAQGIELEPQSKIGPAAQRMEIGGREAERTKEHLEIARENGAKIIADPTIALDAITRQQATFTRQDLARFIHRHSEGKDQFTEAFNKVLGAPELVDLGKDERGRERFTSRDMVETEARLYRSCDDLSQQTGHRVSDAIRDGALARASERGINLSLEQVAAVEHLTSSHDLGLIIGYAGAGKSTLLGVAKEAWEQAGYRVRGLALSGIAAENLELGSGISSRTIASLEYGLSQGRDQISSDDILVIDEAGMVGLRQMERLTSIAEECGAKIVLIGDPEQLQAIEAGAAFRALAERHNRVEITEVRRQNEDWQREATKDLAKGKVREALQSYEAHDQLHAAETREEAREALIEGWDKSRQANPDASRIILVHTNDERRALNLQARERLKLAGELRDEISLKLEIGARDMAAGERVMLLKNDSGLGVKNGMLGEITGLSSTHMSLHLDNGRDISFDLKDYAQIDYGYAATIHKAQGVTVDHTHVLATPGLDRHSAYVALSRHRDRVDLHYGQDDFKDSSSLTATLSRDRAKDMVSDYVQQAQTLPTGDLTSTNQDLEQRKLVLPSNIEIPQALIQKQAALFASRRGIGLETELDAKIDTKTNRDHYRGVFANFVPSNAPAHSKEVATQASLSPAEDRRARLIAAIEKHARSVEDIFEMQDAKLPALPDQRASLQEARKTLNAINPHYSKDLERAYSANASLTQETANGNPRRAIQVLQVEAEIRANPDLRADRFVQRWQTLSRQRNDLLKRDELSTRQRLTATMGEMARGLERDPQVESILRNRQKDLGLSPGLEQSVSRSLLIQLGLQRQRDLGIGI
ncbi:MAG: Ti-type conjugative transfer relaxase TraA [Methylocystaceae bacterium]|nr:Ti-type conjugative transfer relaxase TraA [Methylocystaceae bacterium]NBT97382.1 Ti-type conjugative transfer relaxase TraA [Methylocystaceae bacterium]